MPIATAPALINANSFCATFGAEQLGIGQTVDNGMRRENYGCGDDRASKRSHPNFIHSGDGGHSPAPQFPLEGKIRPYAHLARP